MAQALSILVIGNNKTESASINDSIAKSGISAKVKNTFSALEAFEKINKNSFDLIFLDQELSDSDGFSFLKKLRTQGVDIPVIFITANDDKKMASKAILAGASDYIPKALLIPDGISQSIRNAVRFYRTYNQCNETERVLKFKTNQLSEAQKLAQIGSWELNLIDNSIGFSDEFLNILEIGEDEKPTLDFFKDSIIKDDITLFYKMMDLVKTRKRQISFDHQIIGRRGTVKYVKEYMTCLFDQDQKPYKILGSIQDISKQKRTELELIKAKELAEKSVHVKEQFLANMSHEIRTPMNGIIGFTRILENTSLTKDQQQNVKAIKRAGENLMRIINDILDLSKIEADKLEVEATPFSLSKVIANTVELTEVNAKEKKIGLLTHLDPDVYDYLIGDTLKLSQILINLIGNAIKFTEKGFVELSIKTTNETDKDITLEFTVSDTGIGIPQDKIDSIFESFNQATNDTTRKYGGTGLGLTISKKLIELQGGVLSVKSEIGKGSIFSFTIVYEKTEQSKIPGKAKHHKRINPDFLKGKNILLVEDNELNQLLAFKIFKSWNKEIDIADNGRIAVEKTNQKDYDLILMDVQMPEMDGIQTTIYIRNRLFGAKAKVPIIALTAHASANEEQNCLDAGMNDYLSKPFYANELLEKMYKNLFGSASLESLSILPDDTQTIDITIENNEPEEQLWDLNYLIDFVGGEMEFVHEMIAVFLKNAPISLKEITISIENNDALQLKKDVHKLKSSLALLGAKTATEIIEWIEIDIATNPEAQNWKAPVGKLINMTQQIIEELKIEEEKLHNT